MWYFKILLFGLWIYVFICFLWNLVDYFTGGDDDESGF